MNRPVLPPVTFRTVDGVTSCTACGRTLPPPTGRTTWPPKTEHVWLHTQPELGRLMRAKGQQL